MAKMTRRAMLWATSAGVAAVTGAAALVAGKQLQSAEAAAPTTNVAATGSLTAHIKDVSSGKVSIFMGEREIIVNNPALVHELLGSIH